MLRLVGNMELTRWKPSRYFDTKSHFLQALMLTQILFVVPFGQIEADIDNFLSSAMIRSIICLLMAHKLQHQLEAPLLALLFVVSIYLANLIVKIDVARDDLTCAMRCSSLIKFDVNPGFL